MASFAQPIAFFFFLVLSSSLHIQARESKFFTKFIHLGAKISPLAAPILSPAVAPTLAPTLAPAPANVNSQDPYYGLYGHGSNMFPPAKEGVTTSNTPTTTSNFENDLFADQSYETGYEKNNNNNDEYTTSNYNYNDNDNGYTLSNYKYSTDGYNGNYNDNGYETERQGMSDTRFVEGGKRFYDAGKENYYPNGYEFSSSKESSENEGYYGNTDNSMEDLENKEYEYQERQEEYMP
ncbi:GBF's pro-rich region-interacting factor 1 [Hibiscus syriacus]|uniref:GBF's pro-rich region-interacting factor 1 n=1 Tax=Hibiscus syriacus TaxID=106335 RepID=A0A6A2XJW5_HIBSY|nr:protein E6-like [Hibiscus syriacus]KAE8670140.1 GBF's pro-rich region-interacting factor 1 [Hibiscus syriacus]